MTVPTLHANLLPPRPRLVLRVGFAGVRDLPANMMEPITAVLVSVFETIARQLVEIARSADSTRAAAAHIAVLFARGSLASSHHRTR